MTLTSSLSKDDPSDRGLNDLVEGCTVEVESRDDPSLEEVKVDDETRPRPT